MSNFFSSLVTNLLHSNSNNNSILNQPPKIYLTNDSKMQFPIPPASFEISVKNNNGTVNINNLGELNMIGKTGLITLSLSSFFPNQDYGFCQCTPDKPYNYIKQINTWKDSGKPCRIAITDTPVNYPVTIDAFTYSEKDGTGDVYFTLNLREYKFIGGAADTTVNALTGLQDRTDVSSIKDTSKNVTVYPGDSIMDVASRSLGQKTTGISHLNLYKSIAKLGGVSAGDVLTVKNGKVKIGDVNVSL